MLVPDPAAAPTQVIDVRDLAAWMVGAADARIAGTYDAVGPIVTLGEWIELSRRLGGHRAAVVAALADWLLQQGVEEFMGPESLPLWIADREWIGMSARMGAAAQGAGLRHRDRAELIADVLAWERRQGLERRARGTSPAREREAARCASS